MESESVVYGCIRDWPGPSSSDGNAWRLHNRKVLLELPKEALWPFLGREMFSFCNEQEQGVYHTQVIHFGATYREIEQQWSQWVKRFESLLAQLYWCSAVVHLETELKGRHVFRWSTVDGPHTVAHGTENMRCAWERESR